ncbi:uncharacterized protein LOC100374859 [Saccoglossus kowalevskii]|uniref:Uncharacterized protein LOC100374859 n=1 Tax=Saccoglossus kowalevskii TaxID=10224 RepID=A0ABM0GK53_SACKO|nr:PREDICTED: uncharacterized protein LOC100374859 [Saccoglossus kowalevskii]
MLVTPIQARERSIAELTGYLPAKGTRMYVRQRQHDPDFRDQSYEECLSPEDMSPTEIEPVPRLSTIQASPGKTLLDQYVDTGLVELPSTMKPWSSPWAVAQDQPAPAKSYSHVMTKYRNPHQENGVTNTFRRTGSEKHRRSKSPPASIVKSRELVIQSSGKKARGAVMFDRLKKRSEAFVIDETNVANPTHYYSQKRMNMLQQTRQRSASPPPHIGTGYYPTPQTITHVDAHRSKPRDRKTPWQAAEENPVGSVESAFMPSKKPIDLMLASNLKTAARTKAERDEAYQPWVRTTPDEPSSGHVSFNLPPRITSAPRLRLGATPYVNDFNVKPQGWCGSYEDTTHSDVTEYHTLPRTRHSKQIARDYNSRPKSWNPNYFDDQQHDVQDHGDFYHHDEYEEQASPEQEHLKPVRMTARKFNTPNHAHRRSRSVKPVCGPKIWNPKSVDETDDL